MTLQKNLNRVLGTHLDTDGIFGPATAAAVETFQARMHITVDRTGDTSTYRLSVVQSDAYGRPGNNPYPGFDPRYVTAEFSFGQSCPTHAGSVT